MEDVFALLKAEDDNPRGQAGGRYLSGDSLEAAAAAEQRRLEIKAARWTKGRQEEGILLLIKAKTLFQRLKLPEPRWVDGTAQWHVSREQVDAAYEDLKKACHPEWSFHPEVFEAALKRANTSGFDEATGTIVMGENVRIDTVAVAQGNLIVKVQETPQVSQPNPFAPAGAQTVVVPNTNVTVDEGAGNKVAVLERGATLRDLVAGLNSLGVGPRDLITILQNIKAAGAMQAEIYTR